MSPMLMNLGIAPIPPTPTLADCYIKLTDGVAVRNQPSPKAAARGVANSVRKRKVERERKKKAVLRLIRSGAVTAYDVSDSIGISQFYARQLLMELCAEGKAKQMTGYVRHKFEATEWRKRNAST